jgi:hypothetical protein
MEPSFFILEEPKPGSPQDKAHGTRALKDELLASERLKEVYAFLAAGPASERSHSTAGAPV